MGAGIPGSPGVLYGTFAKHLPPVLLERFQLLLKANGLKTVLRHGNLIAIYQK